MTYANVHFNSIIQATMLKYSLGNIGRNRKNLKATALIQVSGDGGLKYSVNI